MPVELGNVLDVVLQDLYERLDGNQLRALAVTPIGAVSLQILFEIDPRMQFLDTFLDGLLTNSQKTSKSIEFEASDYLTAALFDSSASHTLEVVLRLLPSAAFDTFWKTYLTPRLGKVAVHPVSNYVVAAAISRAGTEQLQQVIGMLQTDSRRFVSESPFSLHG